MNLQPNPPRLITVGIAIAFAVVGVAFAWPIEPAVTVLKPVVDMLGSVGIAADRQLGYLCLFISPALLVAGSLLPGI
jgi:hypothetical protein